MRPAGCYTDQAELHITGRSAVAAIPSLHNESGPVRFRVVVSDAEIVSDHRHSASRSTVQPCAISPVCRSRKGHGQGREATIAAVTLCNRIVI
jgi:hypothetical protein